MIDIANARALVETLKDYAEHPSSFTDISPTEANAAADLIAALLDERDALARDAARVCLWSQDGDYESDTYGTSCGRYYCIIEGAPDENDMKYCCYCGGKLEQVLIEPDGGER
jgi:hypothetical protein